MEAESVQEDAKAEEAKVESEEGKDGDVEMAEAEQKADCFSVLTFVLIGQYFS